MASRCDEVGVGALVEKVTGRDALWVAFVYGSFTCNLHLLGNDLNVLNLNPYNSRMSKTHS